MDLLTTYNQWMLTLKVGKRVSKNTLLAYQQDWQQFAIFFQNYLGEALSLKSLEMLKLSDLRAWLADRHNHAFHSRSTARSLSGIKSFLTFLQEGNFLDDHPIFHLKPPRLKKTLPRPLSSEQTIDFLNNIDQISDQSWVGARDRALFMLIYSAGLRISEALNLKYSDLKCGEYLTIKGKGEKFRQVPFLSKVKEELGLYCQVCPFPFEEETPLFLGIKGKRLATVVAERQMQRYRQLAGLPDWATPHSLRHSCATHLMQSSSNLRAIQELLGHASLSTTQIYTDINQDYLMNVYEKFHPRAKS